jgi:hypothetical protein
MKVGARGMVFFAAYAAAVGLIAWRAAGAGWGAAAFVSPLAARMLAVRLRRRFERPSSRPLRFLLLCVTYGGAFWPLVLGLRPDRPALEPFAALSLFAAVMPVRLVWRPFKPRPDTDHFVTMR